MWQNVTFSHILIKSLFRATKEVENLFGATKDQINATIVIKQFNNILSRMIDNMVQQKATSLQRDIGPSMVLYPLI